MTTFQTAFVQHWQLLLLMQTWLSTGHGAWKQQKYAQKKIIQHPGQTLPGQFGSVPGIEPAPRGWDPGPLATRPYHSDLSNLKVEMSKESEWPLILLWLWCFILKASTPIQQMKKLYLVFTAPIPAFCQHKGGDEQLYWWDWLGIGRDL